MEKIVNTSGLQHLAENIFLNLNYELLKECFKINSSCREILENPLFWLKLFIQRGLSKENQNDWHRAIQLVKNTDLEKNISSYLKRSSKNPRVVDIPCYINEDTIMEYSKMPKLNDTEFRNIYYLNNIPCGCIQLSSPVISKGQGWILMIKAAYHLNEFTFELVNVLAPLIDNPYAIVPLVKSLVIDDPSAKAIVSNFFMEIRPLEIFYETTVYTDTSPLHLAAGFGNTEFMKILAPLAENPNAPDFKGISPIHIAAWKGETEIVKTLIHLTENPNASDIRCETPFDLATKKGYAEIVKLLEPYL